MAMQNIMEEREPAATIYFITAVGHSISTPSSLASFLESPRCSSAEYKAAVQQAGTYLFVDNIDKNHWVVVSICKGTAGAIVYEPVSHNKLDKVRYKAVAMRYLTFLAGLTGDAAFIGYQVDIVVGGTCTGFPFQKDGSSCGVFALIILYHLMFGATLNLKTRDLSTWRKFIAVKTHSLLSV